MIIYLNVGTGKDISIEELAIKIATLSKFKEKFYGIKKCQMGQC